MVPADQLLSTLDQIFNDEDTTVIIVTHNSLIAEIADRVIHIKNGKVESNEKNEHPKNIEEVKWQYVI